MVCLVDIFEIHFQRCIIPAGFADAVAELHHFCDGSQVGFGACSYIRLVSPSGKIHLALVTTKSRLAPLKQVSIPRLELSAAVLSVELDTLLRRELDVHLIGSTLWTDSEIHNESKRHKVSWLIAFLWYDSTASLLGGFMLMGHRILLMWCQGDVLQTTYHSVGLADLRSWDSSRVNGQWHVSLIWRFLTITPRCVRVRCCLHGVVWHLLSQVLILWSCCAVTIPAITASRKLCAGCYGLNLTWWNEPHRLALSRLKKCLLLRRWS